MQTRKTLWVLGGIVFAIVISLSIFLFQERDRLVSVSTDNVPSPQLPPSDVPLPASLPEEPIITFVLKTSKFATKIFLMLAGVHNSGTSLLHYCLVRHPHISGFVNTSSPMDEGQHLQDVLPTAAKLGSALFGLDKQSHLNQDSSLITEENRQRILRSWGKYWNLTKEVLMEKSPINIVRLLFFQAFFTPQQSRFLIIIRHPFDVIRLVSSNVQQMEYLLDNWLVCYEKAKRDLRVLKLNKRNSFRWIKFEDFVKSPKVILRGISRWLGFPDFNPDFITKSQRQRRVMPNRFGFIGNANSEQITIFGSEAYAYRRLIPLAPEIRQKVESVAFDELVKSREKRVNALGYSLVAAKQELLMGTDVFHHKTTD